MSPAYRMRGHPGGQVAGGPVEPLAAAHPLSRVRVRYTCRGMCNKTVGAEGWGICARPFRSPRDHPSGAGSGPAIPSGGSTGGSTTSGVVAVTEYRSVSYLLPVTFEPGSLPGHAWR